MLGLELSVKVFLFHTIEFYNFINGPKSII